MKRLTLLIYIVAFTSLVEIKAQPSQVIKGKVLDKNTLQELPAANVYIMQNGELAHGVSADLDGNFRIDGVAVGRHVLQCTFVGYEPWQSGYLEVTSAKEVVLTIELVPSIFTSEEIVIEASRNMGAGNEFTAVSGRSFTSEETQRYAGS
ncbi:MAG: carboxypeptidase-like regulatory domain-containing protein, partial [Cyclobacteriaceae bacterium]|nr:carboxypeptidase-like regulatory domain-containing protein [Cyclobacteriaceae bacterium]